MQISRRAAMRMAGGSAALLAPGVRRARAAEPVRIGSLTDLSGASSVDSGMPTVYSAQMAIEDFGGEVLGRKVELLFGDDQNKPDIGLGLARKWLDEQGAAAVISNTLSSTGLGVKQMCEARQRVFMVGSSGSSAFTQAECSPLTVAFGVNTYSMPKGVVSALLKQGLDSWFFITSDYAFGHALEADASSFVQQGGGKLLGSVQCPIATSDYSSFLLQAQNSGAKVIGLAVQGIDFENLVKQAAEFGIGKMGQTLAGLFALENQVTGAGLANAGGMATSAAFYWDMNDDTRAFAKRMMQRTGGVPPNGVQVAGYSATLHFLRAVQAAGTTDGPAVVAQMKRMPINDFYSKAVVIREDGQALRPMYLMRVKTPAESTSRYDVFKVAGEVPPDQAWRPLSQSECPFVRKKA